MHWLATVKTWFLANITIFHIVLALVLTITLHVVIALVYKHLFTKLKKEKHIWPLVLIQALRKPIIILLWYLCFITVLLNLIEYIKDIELISSLKTATSLGVTVICIWFLLRAINFSEEAMLQGKIGKKKIDKTTADGISKISRIVLFIAAALAILQAFGVPLAAIYTAAGGAGIGITLAAQDMLKNFFGGLVLYFDRPFSIGDWISSPDKNIEGTVEKIGWRTTRIRTFDKRPLYVPNATFLTVAVENPSRMEFRRIRTDVGVRYSDFNVIPKITQDIEDMIRNDEDIATDQTIWVNLVNFAPSSLQFRIYCFTKTSEWVPFQQIQQKIFIKILEIIEKNGAEAAFPTETLHIPNGVTIHNEEHINVTTATN